MLALLKKLKDIFPPSDKVKLVVLLFLMLIDVFLEVLSIGIIAGFVSVISDPNILFNIGWLKPVLTTLDIKTSEDVLIYGSIVIIGTFIIKNSYLIIYEYIKSRFIYNRYKSISTRLFRLYMSVPYTFHLRRNTADLIRNVSTETESLAGRVMTPILQIVTDGIMTLGVIILLLIVEPVITLVTMFLLGGVSVLFLKATRSRANRHGKEALKERARMIQTVNEGIGGFKETTVMNRQSWFIKQFKSSANILSKAQIFQQISNHSVRPIIETFTISGMLLITLILLKQGRSMASLVSVLALFALSIQRLLPTINNLISQYNVVRYYTYAVDPIYNDLTKLKIQDKNTRESDNGNMYKIPFKNKIELSSVNYSYPGSSELVLKNISLIIPKGSTIGLVGTTGTGKTTIVDLILGLLTPKDGSIKVDGIDIQKNLQGWQRNIGYIPQFIYLSDDTMRNNIAFGLDKKEINEEQLISAVKVSQLYEFVERLPEGLDTYIGERGVRLSGGQRQRIGIARALYHNPEVLIMDEATSSLDNKTEKFVIESIERIKGNRTMIIIAHRLTTVKNCDTLYLIKDGQIIASGNYKELVEKISK